MVNITVDTQIDSANTIRRVISILEEELAKKNDSIMTQEPSQVIQQTTSQTPTSTVGNPFDMFGSGLPSSGGVQPIKNTDLPVSVPETQVYDSEPEAVPTRNSMDMFDSEPARPKIVLDAPQSKGDSYDFEGSARFASQVGTAQDLVGERPKKKDSFFNDLEQF